MKLNALVTYHQIYAADHGQYRSERYDYSNQLQIVRTYVYKHVYISLKAQITRTFISY